MSQSIIKLATHGVQALTPYAPGKPLSELEREYSQNAQRLPFRDQVRQMIANDNQSSVGVMKQWIKEQ